MKKKNDALSAIITVTIVATVAVTAAVAAISYIVYDKFIKLRQITGDSDDESFYEELPESLETMIVDEEEEL